MGKKAGESPSKRRHAREAKELARIIRGDPPKEPVSVSPGITNTGQHSSHRRAKHQLANRKGRT